MAENDLHDDALSRYGNCVDYYFSRHGNIPIEPILYKIVLLVKLAIQEMEKEQIKETEEANAS